MTLRIDIAWLLTVMLVSVRVAAATMLAPVFGPAKISAPVKVGVVLALSAFMASAAMGAAPAFSASLSIGEFARALLFELVLGLSFGFGFVAAHAATQVAGRVLDIQLGFGAASILNPTTQAPAPLLGSLFAMIMIAAFLALDGHHVLVRALVLSLQSLPPTAVIGEEARIAVAMLIEHSGIMFVFGLTLAAPIMFMLWLADVAMAVFARSMPQLNVFLMSFAVKITLGIVGLTLSLGLMRIVLENLFDATYRFWDALAAPAGP